MPYSRDGSPLKGPEDEENAPLCPTCGALMKSRTNSQNGSHFFGCSNFPKCRGIRNADGSTGIGNRTGRASDDADRELPYDSELPSERWRSGDKRRWDR